MTGRPSTYTDEIAARICDRIANGETLVAICKEPGMPSTTTVAYWINSNAGFSAAYARAKDERVDHWADDIVRLADDESLDHNSRRLRVDTRKWLMSKLKPKTYGDKLQHTGADGDGAIQIKVTDDWARPVVEGAKVIAVTDQSAPALHPSDTQPIDNVD